MSKRIMEMLSAGDATDIPGNCKFCGSQVPKDTPHLMHDPSGRDPSIQFCSAECLHKAEHIFDGLTPDQLVKLRKALDEVQEETEVRH